MSDLYDDLQAAAQVIADRTGRASHDTVVVLGSGFGAYANSVEGATTVSYADIPGFPVPSVNGHAGTAYSFTAGDRSVLMLAGRAHAYEGHSMDAVTFAVRTAVLGGCNTVVLTNAAGGIADDISPGDLVIITDHINAAGVSPLAGPNDDRLGPRFPDMTEVYTRSLRDRATQAGQALNIELKQAIYYWTHGPMFETPAEIQMAKIVGAGVVGMSTAPEATAARHMGADVLAISLCSNKAAGISENPLSAAEVYEVASAAEPTIIAFLNQLLATPF